MVGKMSSGIYAITNLSNGKVYVGSTNDFKARWAYHKCRLRCNKHDNSHFQRSWNKYGEEVFEFNILERVDDLDKLIDVEQFWMDFYREEGRKLYNTGKCAYSGRRGGPCSEEHKRKIGKANWRGGSVREQHARVIGWKHSKETKQIMSVNGHGENSGVNKLTENQVLWIRVLVKEGMKQKDVGKLLGMSEPAISMIVHRKRWGWLAG